LPLHGIRETGVTTPADPTGPLPTTANHQTGPVNAPTVQAGTINGDVHFHAAPPPPVHAPRPLYVPGPTHVPMPPLTRRPSPAGVFLRKWLPALLVPMVMGLVVGAIVDSAVGLGREVLPIRLLGIAIVLGTTFLVLFVVSKFASITVDGVVERCTPKVLAAVSTAGLWWWLAVLIALGCTGISQSMPIPAGDPRGKGASGALSAFIVLAIMVVALLVRRRRR
jgi:hypothetical protein